jgi:hypothetical protein
VSGFSFFAIAKVLCLADRAVRKLPEAIMCRIQLDGTPQFAAVMISNGDGR